MSGILEEGAQVLAAVEAYTKRSEDRDGGRPSGRPPSTGQVTGARRGAPDAGGVTP